MKYVLILMWWAYSKGGTITAEFNNQSACEYARLTTMKEFGRAVDGARFVCVPKGIDGNGHLD